MVQLTTGKERRRSKGETLVRIVEGASEQAPDLDEARIVIQVRNPCLSQVISSGVKRALSNAMPAPAEPLPIVCFRTERRLAALEGKGSMDGAIVVLAVTLANRRKLSAYVERARRARALAIQMVWNGNDPPRDFVEPHVFAALELARATPKLAPVFLTPTADRLEIVELAARARKQRRI